MKSLACVAISFACVFASATANAQLITFETTPAGVAPTDNQILNTPYNLTGGGTVSFFFDFNGNNTFDAGIDFFPVFEAIGPDGVDGFANSGAATNDVADAPFGPQLGSWFLRQPIPGTVPPPFIIDYNTLQIITGLSGEIWDIDGGINMGGTLVTEQWNVEVLDVAGTPLVPALLSPLGNNQSLDGRPWTLAFSGLPSGVDKIRITFVGSKQGGLGLAFNNFSPTFPVPEPCATALMAIAIGSVCGCSRRQRSRE